MRESSEHDNGNSTTTNNTCTIATDGATHINTHVEHIIVNNRGAVIDRINISTNNGAGNANDACNKRSAQRNPLAALALGPDPAQDEPTAPCRASGSTPTGASELVMLWLTACRHSCCHRVCYHAC